VSAVVYATAQTTPVLTLRLEVDVSVLDGAPVVVAVRTLPQ